MQPSKAARDSSARFQNYCITSLFYGSCTGPYHKWIHRHSRDGGLGAVILLLDAKEDEGRILSSLVASIQICQQFWNQLHCTGPILWKQCFESEQDFLSQYLVSFVNCVIIRNGDFVDSTASLPDPERSLRN